MAQNAIFVSINLSAYDIENKEVNCSICAKQFISEISLKKHIILEHYNIFESKNMKIVARYFCPIENCKKNEKAGQHFESRKHLVQHFYKVHNSEKFQCDSCDKKFSTEYLKNQHLKNCGTIFCCSVCNNSYGSFEALQTHAKRKSHNHEHLVKKIKPKLKKVQNIEKNSFEISMFLNLESGALPQESLTTRTVATTTRCSSDKASISTCTSSFTETTQSMPLTIFETKSTTTDDMLPVFDDSVSSTTFKLNKNSSTSTTSIDFFNDNENSNSLESSLSSNKKNVNLNSAMQYYEDSLNNSSMELFSAETQTDMNELDIFDSTNNKLSQTDFGNLFNNNYTQTTLNDLDVFEKFDNQTQTNWADFQNEYSLSIASTTETQTLKSEDFL